MKPEEGGNPRVKTHEKLGQQVLKVGEVKM